MDKRKQTVISFAIVFAAIPLITVAGLSLLGEESAAAVTAAVAVLACVPFFVSFEHGRNDARRLMLVAVMVALTVIGRLAFMHVQFVKPVAAMCIFAGMYLGPSSGFVTGALTALISNIYFGQGPYTPFQMLAWGIVGFVAGLLSEKLNRSAILLAIYGALAGVVYSLILDLWSAIWYGGTFQLSYFFMSVVTSLPYTAIYAVSNVVFLLLLKRPFGAALKRLGIKYGL